MALDHVRDADEYAEDEEAMHSMSGRGSDGAVDLKASNAPEDSEKRDGQGKELRRWRDARSALT